MQVPQRERTDRFVLVSRLLLDRDDLAPTVAGTYLAMLDDLDEGWPLDEMAAAFAPLAPLPVPERESRIVDDLRANPTWLAAAASVLKVWYSGQLSRADGTMVPAPPEAFLGALVWPLVGTHPPGAPGPFFGEWAYPPGGPA